MLHNGFFEKKGPFPFEKILKEINSVNDFSFKGKIKGKIGTFSFNNKKIIQDLDIYKVSNNLFTKF